MKKRNETSIPSASQEPGNRSEAAGRLLTTYGVGALPVLNRIIARARIAEFLREFMVEDKRCKISPVTGMLVLLKNYLVSREPIYGISQWARQYDPTLLDLSAEQVAALNDDRVGRCLDRLFDADCPSLLLAITRHVVEEFELDLSEIHNDSTTVTFFGNYDGKEKEGQSRGKTTPALTWGFNKDHRPDLKQILYNLTVSADGAVPVAFGIENGNVTDDQTHQGTWDLLCSIVGGPDFIYVADSKLATKANMTYIANRGGRFISVLPRTRSEDGAFRSELLRGTVDWVHLKTKLGPHGEVADVISASKQEMTTAEGFRLLWFHSLRKVHLDHQARAKVIRRAQYGLDFLRLKLRSPKTRYREQQKVARAVEKCLAEAKAHRWIHVEIRAEDREVFIQEKRGRPSANTRYCKEVRTRFDIAYSVNKEALAEAEKQDGIFPLVTNDRTLSSADALATYKRQAQIEKRFSQLKSQFDVAPVFLKSVHRIVAFLTLYYLALLIQALLERELRRAMKEERIASLPLYHEERKCRAPT
ncbi:MAG: IS1634 family transposase, partial [Dehalococcoidia bacterium]